MIGRERARQPEDLSGFFVARANAGDAAGLAALYESEAALAFPPGQITVGQEAIREAYAQMLAAKPRFEMGTQLPTLHNGDLALTSTRLAIGSPTVEVARRQADGTWLWILDRPGFLE